MRVDPSVGMPSPNPSCIFREGTVVVYFEWSSDCESCSGVPASQSLFTPYQAPPKKKHSRGAGTSSQPPSDGRMALTEGRGPTNPYPGHRGGSANMNGPSCSARRERDPKDPVQQSSGNSQSGSDEQQPSSSNAHVEVTLSALSL